MSNGLVQIRTDIMLFLIWDQTVCKGYLQVTEGAASKERVKHFLVFLFLFQTAFSKCRPNELSGNESSQFMSKYY